MLVLPEAAVCWNNHPSKMLSPCPAALHLLVLTNNCPECRAVWGYGREQDSQKTAQIWSTSAGNSCWCSSFQRGGSKLVQYFLFDTGRSPAPTHLSLFCCQHCLIPLAGWQEQWSAPSRSLTPGEFCVSSISCKSAG